MSVFILALRVRGVDPGGRLSSVPELIIRLYRIIEHADHVVGKRHSSLEPLDADQPVIKTIAPFRPVGDLVATAMTSVSTLTRRRAAQLSTAQKCRMQISKCCASAVRIKSTGGTKKCPHRSP